MPDHLLILLAGAFAGGFVLGLTGFGNGVTAYGLWLYVLSPQLGAPLVAIGSVTAHILMYRGFRHVIYPRRVLPFVLGGLLGVPIGTWLLTIVSVPAFKLFGGVLLVGYSLLTLVGGLRLRVTSENKVLDSFVGWIGGVCAGLASLSGPIITIWCGLKGWSKDEQRGAYQPYNFAMLTLAMVAFGVAGLLTREFWILVALSLPVTVAAMWLGRRLYGHIDDVQFQRIVLVLLTLSGLGLIWTALAG